MRIKLTFIKFDLEDHKSCERDYIEIDGGTKYCGLVKTSFSIISAGSTMTLKFVSDENINKQGFSATWAYTDEEPVTIAILKEQEESLTKNRDAIVDVKAKIAQVTSSFKHLIKTAAYQTRVPATNCHEFLTLVTQRNYELLNKALFFMYTLFSCKCYKSITFKSNDSLYC